MIEIECHCGVGLAGASVSFTREYEADEFEGMDHEQIVSYVHQDAKNYAAANYLEVWVTVPEDLGE